MQTLDEEFEHGAHNVQIQKKVKAASEQPRCLKQLCRVAIYDAVDWKLDQRCRVLPLPNSLISYLVSVE